jgi:Dual specificity phosphatase, catalytic domain
VPHPYDDGVLLGSLGADNTDADAVVSLCQVGCEDFPQVAVGDHVQVWLVDHPGDNNQPHFVIDQAARTIAQLRTERKRVFVHCYAGQSRTPAVAARYASLCQDAAPSDAFDRICAGLGGSAGMVNRELCAAVYELAGQPAPPPAPGRQHPDWSEGRR